VGAGELLGATFLVLLPLVACGALAWRIVTRALPAPAPLEAVLAGLLVTTTGLLAVMALPLALGVLSQGSVLAATAIVAVAAVLVRGPGVRPGGREAPRPAPPGSRAGWALAALGGGAVLVAALANVRTRLPEVLTNIDTIGFNLPQAARWIETGSLWQLDEWVPLQAHSSYPGSGTLLMAWTMLPTDSDVLVRPLAVALLAWFAVAAFALARELGARPSAALLAAAALLAVPIAATASIRHAFPDALLLAGMTTGALFALRAARTGRGADVVLTGIGLGLGIGTKWYGASSAAVIVAVWAAARLAGGTPLRTAARDALLAGTVALAVGGIWLLRNLVEIGNPLFPVEIPGIFDAAPDVVRDQVGFSVLDYLTDPAVLADPIAPSILRALGGLAVAGVVLAAAAAAVRRREDRRVAAVAVAGVLLALAYAATPYTALGLEGAPAASLVEANARYALPAIVALTAAGATLGGRLRPDWLAEAALAACALAALPSAFEPLRAGSTAAAMLVLGVAAAVGLGLRRLHGDARRAGLAGAGLLAAVAAAVVLVRTESTMGGQRYRDFDPVFAALQDAPPLEIGISGSFSTAGLAPTWPAFGARAQHDVTYVGRDVGGWLTAAPDAATFARIVRERGMDAVVVGRGATPQPRVREEAWARAAGLRELVRSDRLVLFVTPQVARAAGAAG
jgi:hypothetical protein